MAEPFVDPYLIPGSDVLRNIPGYTSRDDLEGFEHEAVFARSWQLVQNPRLVRTTWDGDHWKALHRHLFQDVYDWAGQFRTVDIHKGSHHFHPRAYMQPAVDYATQLMGQLIETPPGSRPQVVRELGKLLGVCNDTHPFREGNGRTQRLLVGQVAARCGYTIRWENVTEHENLAASIHDDFANLLDRVIVENLPARQGRHPRPGPTRTPSTTRSRPPTPDLQL